MKGASLSFCPITAFNSGGIKLCSPVVVLVLNTEKYNRRQLYCNIVEFVVTIW